MLPEIKLLPEELELINNIQDHNIKSHFGAWIDSIDELKEKFSNSKPVKHIIIDNFLNMDFARKCAENYPDNFLENPSWHKYNNPIEVKYANDKLETFSVHQKDLIYFLSSKYITGLFRYITGLDLEIDPYIHGAGLHVHPRYGRLGLHLDYERHIYLKDKQRQLNIILYLSENWKPEWKGDTQLWSSDCKKCEISSPVVFNSAIIFQTNEISWHGLPESIMCPEDVYRKTIAYYYLSPLSFKKDVSKNGANEDGYRYKACFVKRPEDPELQQMKELYKIRPNRRIEKEDMDKIWPEWTPELF